MRPFFYEKPNIGSDGRLKLKIYILFYGENAWTVALRQIKFGAVKFRNLLTSVIWTIILSDLSFKNGEKFWGYFGTIAEPLCV
jgi:hypothetical protein